MSWGGSVSGAAILLKTNLLRAGNLSGKNAEADLATSNGAELYFAPLWPWPAFVRRAGHLPICFISVGFNMHDAPNATDPFVGDLEEAYRRALAANEAAESIIGPDVTAEMGGPVVSEPSAEPDRTALPRVETADHVPGASETPAATHVPKPKRVIEAALFVGGDSLTTKKLCSLFSGHLSHESVSDAVDELNREYETEGRPYTILFGEGGYRLTLRPDFERVRNRVYGQGPREIRLSQESLEVLALVAYFQPITKEEIEERGKRNAGPFLRQLLRRELIALERDPGQPKRVQYGTTARFLSLFGLGHIDELPRADDLNFK